VKTQKIFAFFLSHYKLKQGFKKTLSFLTNFSKKESGSQLSVQKGIETVEPKL